MSPSLIVEPCFLFFLIASEKFWPRPPALLAAVRVATTTPLKSITGDAFLEPTETFASSYIILSYWSAERKSTRLPEPSPLSAQSWSCPPFGGQWFFWAR